MIAITMAACAWLIGLAIHQGHGTYSLRGLFLLSGAIAAATAAQVPRVAQLFRVSSRVARWLLLLGIAVEGGLLIAVAGAVKAMAAALAVVTALGLAQAANLGRWRLRMLAIALIVSTFVFGAVVVATRQMPVDVLMFQQLGANALLHGVNPYTIKFPNLYPPNTPYYGPGVVDEATNTLTISFPYPPLSLLMVLPAYALAGDVRFANVVAIALCSALMATARTGRWSGLVGALLLLTPEALYIVANSWTEPLMAFTFSLVMFAALRWQAALPFALGLFFATKQNSVLAVPLVWLLVGGADRRRQYVGLMLKATAVTCVLTAPFFLWDPHAFWHSVVEFQFLQPPRADALSYLVWMHDALPKSDLLLWTPFVLLVPAIAFALKYGERSPAGFAAALTLVNLVFVAFNKQAFANYYYFVIATACWAAAVDADHAEESGGRPVPAHTGKRGWGQKGKKKKRRSTPPNPGPTLAAVSRGHRGAREEEPNYT